MTHINAPHDPRIPQRQAASPHQSVWVSANAGTGKTRVLVDRLLRLLLDDVPPHSILCITFTKAAAAEIGERVRETIAQWVTLSHDTLVETLTDITGQSPDQQTLDKARSLFGRMINHDRTLSIQTIHSFCQSVLARFPLEANILPGFAIAGDDQIQELQQEAFSRVLRQSVHDTDLRTACLDLFELADHTQILSLLRTLQHQQDKWAVADHTILDQQLRHILSIPDHATAESLEQDFYSAIQEIDLRNLISDLSALDGKTGPKLADALTLFVNQYATRSGRPDITQAILTQNGTINHNIAGLSKKLAPHSAACLEQFCERVLYTHHTLRSFALYKRNISILIMASHFCDMYQNLKQHHALLDYNDQIRMTARLLTEQNRAPWVMFKLDGGIRHLLVDEAQDTSPAQWKIVRALADEMAAGDGRYTSSERSIFIVGDEKQSIYSFQDADIASYQHNRHALKDLFRSRDLPWDDIPLITNFRSSPAILNSVDGIFAADELRQSVTQDAHIVHQAFHAARPGYVEAWPLFTNDDVTTDEDYMPVSVVHERKATEYLCQHLADTIKDWLSSKRVLAHTHKPVQPSDILILLQNRRPLLHPLIKALKDRHIPVSGVDRLVLTEQLIVKDIMAMLQIMLLPHDDLTLASLLKSPFFALSEDALFALAHGRDTESLWERLNNAAQHKAITAYIHDLMDHVRLGAGPYHMINLMMNRPCPADTQSGRHALITRLGFDSEDALDELLNMALQFEQQQRPDIQLFLSWLRHNDTEIKRDTQNPHHNHVRIMTVHGSKGLQAPIVILADASGKPSLFKGNRDVLWHDNMPLWITQDSLPPSLTASLEQQNAATLDEYYRLFYVAMTRAESELYVAGWKKDREEQKDTRDWHQLVMDYLQQHGTACQPDADQSAYGLRFEGHVSDHSKKSEKTISPDATNIMPDLRSLPWIHTKPPQLSDDKPCPLKPSRAPFYDDPALSPLQQDKTTRFARGQIVHKILQHLTAYPEFEQDHALTHMLGYSEFNIAPDEQINLKQEILSVLRNPDCAFIWTTQGHNEISVTGEITYNGQDFAVVGVIDRLVFHNNAWWIVDYKTNRPPPASWDQVSASYLFQIASYRALIQKLYPDHPVQGLLIWTHTNHVMPVPDDRLDAVLKSQ